MSASEEEVVELITVCHWLNKTGHLGNNTPEASHEEGNFNTWPRKGMEDHIAQEHVESSRIQ